MIFWLVVILIFLGLALAVLGFINWEPTQDKKGFRYFMHNNDDDIYHVGLVIAGVSGVIAAIMLFHIVSAQVSADGRRATHEQEYNALVYKAQTANIRDEFGIVNKEYIDEVQAWNENLAKYQAYSHSFWIGIFYPEKVADGLEFIDFNSIKMKD